MLLRVKPVLTFFITALVFFFIAEFLSFFLASTDSRRESWKGYYQIICGSEKTYTVIENLLFHNGFGGIISGNTEKVSVFSYKKGKKKIPLSLVPRYFIHADPLYDPYLKKLDGYFKGMYGKKQVHVLYIPARFSPLFTYITLKKVLKSVGGWWKFINFMPVRKLFLLFIIIAGEFSLYKLAENKKIFFVSFVSWVFPFVFGSFFSTMSFLSFQFFWIMLMNRLVPLYGAYLDYRIIDRTMVKKLVAGGLFYSAFCVGMFVGMRGIIHPLIVVVSLCIQLSGTAVLFGYIYLQHVYRAHKLFSPVSIKERWRCLKFNNMYAAGIFFALFLSAPFLYWLSSAGKEILLAEPYAVIRNTDISYNSLQKLSSDRTENVLPDLSDYLSHMAFLEGFMYGNTFSFPRQGTGISLSVFRKSGALARRENNTIKLFTDSWYKSIMDSVNNSSVPGMLVKQGVPVGVKYRNVNRISQSEGNLRKYYLVFTFLLFPFLFWTGIGFTFSDGKIKRLFIRRRRQVV